MLCGGPCIALFSATELERLVCGTPLLDFAALQGAAKYEGYTPVDQARRASPVPSSFPALRPAGPILNARMSGRGDLRQNCPLHPRSWVVRTVLVL